MNHNNRKDINILKNNYKENNTITKSKVLGLTETTSVHRCITMK